jgi:Rod binding domain-containing protein
MMISASKLLNTVATVNEAATELNKLKKATDSLEGFMFKTLLQQMGGEKGLFGSNVPGGQIYRDMFESNMSDLLAQRGTLGISNTIYGKVAPIALAQAQERLKDSFIENKK